MKITKILTPVLYLLALSPAQTAPLVKATRIPGTFDRPLYVTSAPGASTLLFVVEQTGRMSGSGRMVAVVRGTRRARIGVGTTGPGAALWVEAVPQSEPPITGHTRELAKEYKELAISILQHREAWQVVDMVQAITEPSALADTAGYAPYLGDAQKVELLETISVDERLTKLLAWGREHLAELEVADLIRKDVTEGVEKQQREFLLRRQLAAVRKELAELDGKTASEEDDYRERVEAADLPDAVRAAGKWPGAVCASGESF